MKNQKQQHQAFNPNSSDYLSRREAITAEINSNKASLDKSVFAKTAKEKEELKRVKREHKNSLKSIS